MAQIRNMKLTKFYRPVAAGNLPGFAFPATWKIPRVKKKKKNLLHPPSVYTLLLLFSIYEIFIPLSLLHQYFSMTLIPILYCLTYTHTHTHSYQPHIPYIQITSRFFLLLNTVLFILLASAIFLGCPYTFPESLKFS